MAKSKKVNKEKEPAEELSPMRDIFDAALKKVDLISGIEYLPKLNSGILSVDLVNGGGFCYGVSIPVGLEQSGKTTIGVSTLGQAVKQRVPIIGVFDAENALNPEHSGRILQALAGISDLESIFKGRVSYTDTALIEPIFKTIHRTLNGLPDKRFRDRQPYLVFDKDQKELMEKMGLKPEKALSSARQMWCQTDNDHPQAFFLVDALNALVPKDVDEEEVTGDALALEARLLGRYLRLVRGKMRSKGCVALLVNQIRINPGQRFGCFPYNTEVLLEDGTTEQIGKIVNQKKRVRVMSYNVDTGEFEPKDVVDWFNNGKVVRTEICRVKTTGGEDRSALMTTKGHKILSNGGFAAAGSLRTGSEVMQMVDHLATTSDQDQLIIGAVFGDGTVRTNGDGSFSISWGHVNYVKDYVSFKSSMLAGSPVKKQPGYKTLDGDSRRLYTATSAPLASVMSEQDVLSLYTYPCSGRRNKGFLPHIFEKMDLKGLAIWFMDDGTRNNKRVSIRCGRFTRSDRKFAARHLRTLTGLPWKECEGGIRLRTNDQARQFIELIAPYIHPSMVYKVEEAAHAVGSYKWSSTLEEVSSARSLAVEWVKPVHSASDWYKGFKYDIQVEGNSTYVVVRGGRKIIVHNSPEYETCGNAPKQFSDIRIKLEGRVPPDGFVRDKENGSISYEPSLEKGHFDRYAFKAVKNIKNKYGSPFRRTMVRVWLSDYKGRGWGFDPVYDAFQFMNMIGAVEKIRGGKFAVRELDGSAGKLLKPLTGHQWTWHDWKTVVLAGIFPRYKGLVEKNSLPKVKVRDRLYEILNTGEAEVLYNKAKASKDDE